MDDENKIRERLKTKTIMLGADITSELRVQLAKQQASVFKNATSDDLDPIKELDDANLKSLPDNFFYYDDEKKEGEEDSSNKYSIFGGNDPLKENNTEEELLSNDINLESTDNIIERKRKETKKIAAKIVNEIMNPKSQDRENGDIKNEIIQEVENELDNTKYQLKDEIINSDKTQSNTDVEVKATSLNIKKNLIVKEGISFMTDSLLVGFLISFHKNPNGDFYELRAGKLIITNQPVSNINSLVITDDSISSMHALMKISENEITLFDQFSENGTSVKHMKDEEIKKISGDSEKILDKDLITFGNITFKVCLI